MRDPLVHFIPGAQPSTFHRAIIDQGQRVIGWVSGGAASAVTCKLAIAKYGLARVCLAYIDTGSEHEDTERFLTDLESWYGKKIIRLKSTQFDDTWDVWESEQFLRGQMGAPCTRSLKRDVRATFERPDDIQCFGFTSDKRELSRADEFKAHHLEIMVETLLIEEGLTKDDCYAIITAAGLTLPAVYRLGFDNNNCIPCVKAEGARYWNRIRRHFPAAFWRMARLERRLGFALCRITIDGERVAIHLDQLDPDAGSDDDTPEAFDCGITCFQAVKKITRPTWRAA